MQDKPASKPSIVPSVIMAAAANKNMRVCAAAVFVAKQVADELVYNKEYYQDLIKYNFFNAVKSDKTYDKVNFTDLPPKEKKQVAALYKKFDNFSTAEIFRILGTVRTEHNQFSPIEAKWAFTYINKFNTTEYDEKNTLTDDEVLLPLNSYQLGQYCNLF
jgi:hypothetical protein